MRENLNIEKMKTVAVVFCILLLSVVFTSIPNAWSLTTADYRINTADDLIVFCEFFYDEYLLLGELAFLQQHQYNPNLRVCNILYEHIVWPTQHPNRNAILVAEIEKLFGDSSYIKERHLRDFIKIPDWIKRDAKMWTKGEITDSRFAYLIRALIETQVIIPPKIEGFESRYCLEGEICLSPEDYVKYSITDNYGKAVTIKYIFNEITHKGISVTIEKISKDGKQTRDLLIDLELGFELRQEIEDQLNDNSLGECCSPETIFHKLPVERNSEMSGSIHDLKVVGSTQYFFDEINRESWIAVDESGQYNEIIDKNSGLVFLTKFEKREAFPKWEKVELIDTNFFLKKTGIVYDLSIPKWWMKNTEWLLDGRISEQEYIFGIQFLLGKQIFKV